MAINREKINGKYTGRWVIRTNYTDIMGDKKKLFKRGFKTKKDAQEYEREFLNNLSHTADTPFKNIINQFREDKKAVCKLTTYRSTYSQAIMKHFKYFYNLKLTEIKPYNIREWQREFLLNSNLKPSTQKQINTVLKNIFSWCIKYRGLKENPFNLVDPIKRAGAKKEHNFLTLDELKLINDCFNYEDRLLINFLFWTGCRIGEVLALTVKDIDFKNKTVTINKTMLRVDKTNLITTPKTQTSNRIINLSNNLFNDLTEYLKLKMYTEDNYIFNQSRTAIRLKFKKVVKNKLNKDMTTHDLRHSHTSLLINNGVELLAISQRLGHSNPSITLNTYSHLYKQSQLKTLNKLNELEQLN